MCRSIACGHSKNRRCPSHRDPSRKLLASAVQRLARWEKAALAAEEAGDEAKSDRAMQYLVSAIDDIAARSQITLPPPKPELPEPLDSFELTRIDDDDLEALWSQRGNDPAGQELIEREWSRRAMHDRRDVDRDAFPFTSYATLVERLHEPEELSDTALKEAWLDGHTDPQLRELAEAEMDRRMLARAGDPTADPDLAEAVEERVDWSYDNLSPTEFRRYQATMITDPDRRRQLPARTVGKATEREVRQEYEEFVFERYLAAEDHCRGHMLNARGRALNVDAFSLFSGNSKRAQAYGSEELLGFMGATGGHMSYARFKNVRSSGKDYDESRIERFDNATHAVSV